MTRDTKRPLRAGTPAPPRRAAAAAATAAAALLTFAAGTAAPGSRALAAPPGATRLLSLSFHDADAADVLRAIAVESGISIAISPSVKGKMISVRLRNVTPEEALQLVTQAAGVTFRRSDGAYVVGSAEELKKSGGPGAAAEASASYPLQHLAPAAAKSLLEGALPYLSVQTAEGTNAVLLSGTQADVLQAQRLLGFADVPAAPVSEVVTPSHVSAPFLADIALQAIPDLHVEVHENTLVATGTREAVDRLKAIVPSVDTPTAASQKVEVYRIRFSSAAALTAMLSSTFPTLQVTPSAEPYAPPPGQFRPLTGGALGSGVAAGSTGAPMTGTPVSGVPGAAGALTVSVAKSRQLLLMGPDTVIQQALALLKVVDVAPAQIEISARIMDVTNANDLDLGIRWGSVSQSNSGSSGGSTGGSGSSTSVQFTPGQSSPTSPIQIQEQNVPGLFQFGRFMRSPLDLATELHFLETRNRAKTLASPRIAAIDNEDASIFIGDIVRFQTLASSSATAGNAFTVQEVPSGVTLLVRPRVNDNGDITLKVHPVVSTFTLDAQNLPQTHTREADTTLRIKDGETIVIGGLMRDDEVKNLEQVPLLGDIPFFGELFRHRSNTRSHSEVIIFLTPHILPDSGGSAVAQTDTTIAAPEKSIADAKGGHTK